MRSNTIRITKSNRQKLYELLLPIARMYALAAVNAGAVVYVYRRSHSLFRVTHKKKSVLFSGAFTPINALSSSAIADNKHQSAMVFDDARIPTPRGLRLTREQFDADDWSIGDLAFPLVVKPLSGTIKGLGVITGIRTRKDLNKYLQISFRQHRIMLVQEFFDGAKEYRVLVLDDEVIGVVERIPAYVIGDGISSLTQLIKAKNIIRKANTLVKMGSIRIDAELKNTISGMRLTLQSVPKKGRHVQLKNVCNFGAGGETRDATDEICLANKRLAVRAAKALDLRFVGLDFLCQDIAKPFWRSSGTILEANQHPDIAMHVSAEGVVDRHIPDKIITALF